jgi:predicted nuclease with TOPRIM domain
LKNLSASVSVNHQHSALLGSGVTDRLIFSINMIKEVLQSNLQLREDLLKLQQEHERTNIQNYQLQNENEDLRERLALLTGDKGLAIEYLPAMLNIEEEVQQIKSRGDLDQAKKSILSYIFSLRKECR